MCRRGDEGGEKKRGRRKIAKRKKLDEGIRLKRKILSLLSSFGLDDIL